MSQDKKSQLTFFDKQDKESQDKKSQTKGHGQKVATDSFRQIGQEFTICNLKKNNIIVNVE